MSEKWQKSLWQPHGFVQIGTISHQRFKYGNNIMGDHKSQNIEQIRSWASTLYVMTLCTAKKLQSLTLLSMNRKEIKA